MHSASITICPVLRPVGSGVTALMAAGPQHAIMATCSSLNPASHNLHGWLALCSPQKPGAVLTTKARRRAHHKNQAACQIISQKLAAASQKTWQNTSLQVRLVRVNACC